MCWTKISPKWGVATWLTQFDVAGVNPAMTKGNWNRYSPFLDVDNSDACGKEWNGEDLVACIFHERPKICASTCPRARIWQIRSDRRWMFWGARQQKQPVLIGASGNHRNWSMSVGADAKHWEKHSNTTRQGKRGKGCNFYPFLQSMQRVGRA